MPAPFARSLCHPALSSRFVRPLGHPADASYIHAMIMSPLFHLAGRILAASRRAAAVLTILVLASGSAGLPAAADQRDPRLDGLFADLQRTGSMSEAETIVAEIWIRWTAFDSDSRASSLMAVGMQMMGDGRLESAERVFTELVGIHPDHAEAWNKRATVRFMRGDDAGSRRDIARVIELEPRHFGALSGLGMINVRRGDLTGALQAFEAALRVNPHMPQATDMVTRLRKRLGGRAL